LGKRWFAFSRMDGFINEVLDHLRWKSLLFEAKLNLRHFPPASLGALLMPLAERAQGIVVPITKFKQLAR
jgi:hypothetical protein